MKHGRTLSIMICLAVALAVTAGWAQAKTLDEIIKAGEIRVGINPTLPPLGVLYFSWQPPAQKENPDQR